MVVKSWICLKVPLGKFPVLAEVIIQIEKKGVSCSKNAFIEWNLVVNWPTDLKATL